MADADADKSFVCKQCGYGADSRLRFQEHMNTHTGARPFKCEECGLTFSQHRGLAHHLKKHVPMEMRPFPCRFCPHRSHTRSDIAAHERRHNVGALLACEICGAGYTRPETLRRHKRRKHPETMPYACSGCGEVFASLRNANKHVDMCRTHQCAICGDLFGERQMAIDCERGHIMADWLVMLEMKVRESDMVGCSFCERKFEALAEAQRCERFHTMKNCFFIEEDDDDE